MLTSLEMGTDTVVGPGVGGTEAVGPGVGVLWGPGVGAIPRP